MAMSEAELAERLREKPEVSDEELLMFRPMEEGRFGVISEGAVIPLLRAGINSTFQVLPTEEEAPFWDAANARTVCASIPPVVDRRPEQSPVKHQLDRGTCVSFASLAAIEASLLRHSDAATLSEQFAHWQFSRAKGLNQCQEEIATIDSARVLTLRGVCDSTRARYTSRAAIRFNCQTGPGADAQDNAVFGIGSYWIIRDVGLNGPSIRNTDYLECILASGNDIVFSIDVAWGLNNGTSVFDVRRIRGSGLPLPSRGGHAMLCVGYNKEDDPKFFMFKNSYGPGDGVGGYKFLSYEYVSVYAKYGYIVRSIRTDMPV